MILAICSTKGGVSKSTLATNLTIAFAHSGKDVLLIDGDEQRSAMDFTSARQESLGKAGYTAVELHGQNIKNQVRQLAPKYDDIIIDVGGRDTGSLRAALLVADLVLIPVQPSSFDLWALDQTVELFREAKGFNDRLRAYAVLSIADPVGKDNEEALTIMRDYPDVQLLSTVIVRRKVFRNASATGKSVLEYQPRDAKAAAEVEELAKSIMTISEEYHGVIA